MITLLVMLEVLLIRPWVAELLGLVIEPILLHPVDPLLLPVLAALSPPLGLVEVVEVVIVVHWLVSSLR